MIDAAVELVMHPARGHAVQHRQRLVDQIIIVEQAALLLLAPVIGRGRSGDMQQRLGAVAGDHRAAFLDQGREADDFRIEQSTNRSVLFDKAIGDDRRPRRAFISEKYSEIFVDLGCSGKCQRSPQPIGLLLVGFTARIKN
jgi:hypothetical protein